MRTKLNHGTGVGAFHSSPSELQGFCGARFGSMKIDQTKLTMKMRNDAPSRYAPIDETSFQACRLCCVGEDASRHAEDAHEEQREEREVEEQEHAPEVRRC